MLEHRRRAKIAELFLVTSVTTRMSDKSISNFHKTRFSPPSIWSHKIHITKLH